jgi:predicted DNA-binding protein
MKSGYTLRKRGRIVTRVQVLLTEEQDQRLEALARRLAKSKSTLVREGVERVLQDREGGTSDALLELIGQAGRAGRKDISRRHDAYLAEAKRRRAR